MSNPFIDLPPAEPTKNPFFALAAELSPVQAPAPVPSTVPPCGDAACRRSHRPSGKHYSDDRETRMVELQEDGKMGPQFGKLGGQNAKTKKRATQEIAAAAAEAAEDIKQVFLDGIDPSQPIGIRIQAAEKFLKVDQADIARESAEKQAALEGMNKEQLVGQILETLGRLGGAAQIAREVEEMVIDGEVIEEDD